MPSRWGGVDLNPCNIMLDVSGQVKLVDLFLDPGGLRVKCSRTAVA
jgi:hypothetical protein